MGCDYYIDETKKCINLQRERCYYYHSRDEYLEIQQPMKKYQLKPKAEPIVIYKNNSFITPEFEIV